jgi:hypothetical protein
MTDVDAILLEYIKPGKFDWPEPVAIMEAKVFNAKENELQINALRVLSDRAGLPFFQLNYRFDPELYQIVRQNELAKQWIADRELFDGQSIKVFMQKIRGRT